MRKSEILDKLSKNKNTLFAKYNLSKIAVFGSVARDEDDENSDIDLLYALKDGCKISFDAYLELEGELQKLLKAKVDLVYESKLNPIVKYHAQKDFIYV